MTLGKASKVNEASWPAIILAASASEKLADTRSAVVLVKTIKPVAEVVFVACVKAVPTLPPIAVEIDATSPETGAFTTAPATFFNA